MEWDPTQFFRSTAPAVPYALLVLNQPINQNAWSILKRHACFTICADGGANRFYDLTKKRGTESIELPDAIVGDLDSITPHVRAHYEKLNVEVVQMPDQYSTDFNKCLRYLRSHKERILSAAALSSIQAQATGSVRKSSESSQDSRKNSRELDVIVMGGLGGRVDQAFSQIHYLYSCTQLPPSDAGRPEGNLYLVSEESVSFILPQGFNMILTPGGSKLGHKPASPPSTASDIQSHAPNGHVARDFEVEKSNACLSENVGIIPVAGPAVITLTGFEWDVQDWKTEIGGQLSTSNHIRADVVTVETSIPVLFTIELAPHLKFNGGRVH